MWVGGEMEKFNEKKIGAISEKHRGPVACMFLSELSVVTCLNFTVFYDVGEAIWI